MLRPQQQKQPSDLPRTTPLPSPRLSCRLPPPRTEPQAAGRRLRLARMTLVLDRYPHPVPAPNQLAPHPPRLLAEPRPPDPATRDHMNQACNQCGGGHATLLETWSMQSLLAGCDDCCPGWGKTVLSYGLSITEHLRRHPEVVRLGNGSAALGAIHHMLRTRDIALHENASCVLTAVEATLNLLNKLPPSALDDTLLPSLTLVWYKNVMCPVPPPVSVELALDEQLQTIEERYAFLHRAYQSASLRLGAPQFNVGIHSQKPDGSWSWESNVTQAQVAEAFELGAVLMVVEGECARDVCVQATESQSKGDPCTYHTTCAHYTTQTTEPIETSVPTTERLTMDCCPDLYAIPYCSHHRSQATCAHCHSTPRIATATPPHRPREMRISRSPL